MFFENFKFLPNCTSLQRLQTHTEYKTVSPVWNRRLELPVGDINSVLHVSVYDEDRNHS